jgi:hypothetical protein
MQGIGYQSYRKLRIAEGIPPGSIEFKGYERYCVYWGRSHQIDHESGLVARGPLKFGRGKFTTALQRGRNEGGADFRIYAEIILDSEAATYAVENKISEMMYGRREVGDQGQRELYDILDNEIENTVKISAQLIEDETDFWIHEVNLYLNERRSIEFTRDPSKVRSLNKPDNLFSLMFEDQ